MNLLTTFTQSPSLKASQSRNSSDFLLAQITSLKVPSSNLLNGKRQVISKTEDDLNSTETTMSKKFKPNEGSPAIELAKPDVVIQKKEVQYRQTKKKASKSQKNAIIVDEDEEDCLIIENPVVKNSGNTWVCEENSSLDKYFDSLLNPLNQQLDFKTDNLPFEYPFTKDFEILIVDDYEDHLTCESTPVINEEDLELQKQNSVESNDIRKENEKTDQYAQIPTLNRKQNKIRNLKCIWQPNCESFEKWSEGIGKAVGIQITNQEKILKTMKNFDMDLKATLEVIKRNKAQYKDYFRIKKISKF